MKSLSKKPKKGCPVCDGVDAKSCDRCRGKTRMCDWFLTDTGWAHYLDLTLFEKRKADRLY